MRRVIAAFSGTAPAMANLSGFVMDLRPSGGRLVPESLTLMPFPQRQAALLRAGRSTPRRSPVDAELQLALRGALHVLRLATGRGLSHIEDVHARELHTLCRRPRCFERGGRRRVGHRLMQNCSSPCVAPFTYHAWPPAEALATSRMSTPVSFTHCVVGFQ